MCIRDRAITVNITFTVDDDATGVIVNEAEITQAIDENGVIVTDVASSNDGDDAGDEPAPPALLQIQPPGSFDLALIKQLDDGTNIATTEPGGTVTFTLTVTNQGNVDATDIELIDHIPQGITLNDPNWTNNANNTATLTNPIPSLPAGSCLLYTSPSPRDRTRSRMPSSA